MKNYIDGVKPLDINRVEVTAQVRDVLCELLRDMSVRLGYSKSSDWGGMQRPSYAGAWVCRVLMPSGEIEDLTKIHGRTIKHLFDCGVISVDDTISSVSVYCSSCLLMR
ncbi:hypothetical protein JCM19237_260 [Photobacterium aphoticum]|uniref:Uncharacterized protein n=1 Tax=Photobacterium aphoticum TaxID=754436 RepID=A0A090QXE4_9GAMM|nr:hypothetical protein JCM19237_260 [Photobacterium aphoticum]